MGCSILVQNEKSGVRAVEMLPEADGVSECAVVDRLEPAACFYLRRNCNNGNEQPSIDFPVGSSAGQPYGGRT